MIELILGVGLLAFGCLVYLHENDIKYLDKRVDFLMLAVVSGVLDEQASGDGEADFDLIVRKIDEAFGRY